MGKAVSAAERWTRVGEEKGEWRGKEEKLQQQLNSESMSVQWPAVEMMS